MVSLHCTWPHAIRWAFLAPGWKDELGIQSAGLSGWQSPPYGISMPLTVSVSQWHPEAPLLPNVLWHKGAGPEVISEHVLQCSAPEVGEKEEKQTHNAASQKPIWKILPNFAAHKRKDVTAVSPNLTTILHNLWHRQQWIMKQKYSF